jgi:hypothetical protein
MGGADAGAAVGEVDPVEEVPFTGATGGAFALARVPGIWACGLGRSELWVTGVRVRVVRPVFAAPRVNILTFTA